MGQNFFFSVINFMLFLLVLVYLLRTPMRKFFKQRNTKVSEDMSISLEMKAMAQENLEKSTVKNSHLIEDKTQINDECQKEAHHYHKIQEQYLASELKRIEKEEQYREGSYQRLQQQLLETEVKRALLKEVMEKLKTGLSDDVHRCLIQENLKNMQQIGKGA